MDTLLLADPPPHQRVPAPPGWLADHVPPGRCPRETLIARCRAELDWALSDWIGLRTDPEEAEVRLPHEEAAARLLNAWGHLHPLEFQIRKIKARLRLQDIAATNTAAWQRRAESARADLRWYWVARRKRLPGFLALAAAYDAAARAARAPVRRTADPRPAPEPWPTSSPPPAAASATP